ncbi:MAG: 50S ribosomal protein L4 [Prevotellaceae bacterium]|jgi:large subunit ribosomal protein L4|nr:50S ribosomal protein L4 [Prevotellaceae bacterium]
MEVAVYTKDGNKSAKTVTLDDTIFGIEPNDHAIYLDVKQYLANQRQGTHKTKEKWEVAYSTKKVIRQKGTGGARHGSIKANIYVGGGRVFGPRPRDYSFKLNKKLKQLARKSALTYKAKNEGLIVLESLEMDAPKTKEIINISKNLKVADKKLLMVLPEANKNVYLSSRNLPNVKTVVASDLTTYDIVNASSLILTEKSVEVLHGVFGIGNE